MSTQEEDSDWLSKLTSLNPLKRLKWNRCLAKLSDKAPFGEDHRPQISIPQRDLMVETERDASVENPQIHREIFTDLHPL